MGEEKHCLGGGKAPECVTWTLPVQQTPGQCFPPRVPLNFFNFLDDMDSPQKHYRLTGKLLENRVPTFISICGLSTFCHGFEAVLIYLLASILSSASHFLLPPRTFHLYSPQAVPSAQMLFAFLSRCLYVPFE